MAEDAKTNEYDEKKVMALRTFADDVKRAREEKGLSEQKGVAPPPQEELEALQQKESAAPTPPPTQEVSATKTPTPEEGTGAEDGVEFDAPLEVPPFHAIRASSPDDTTYTDEESIEIADKESLKKETVRKTAPPQRAGVPTQGVTFDTAGIPEQQPSVHAQSGIFDAEEALEGAGEGTIVLDRKRKRFRLFPAIFASLKQWFGSKKDEFEEARRPKHVVEKAERRKEVIEAAARESKHAPRDDFEDVSERLRNVERVSTNDELQIKEAEVAIPRWRYVDGDNSEPEETTRPQQEPDPATEEEEQEAGASIAQPEPPEPPRTPAPEPNVSSEPIEAPIRPRRAAEGSGFAEYREKYGEDYNPREDSFGESLPPAAEEVTPEEVERPRLQRQEVPDYRLQRVGQPRRETGSRGTPYLTMIAVVFAAVILGVGTTIWWFTRDAAQVATAPVPSTPALVESQADLEVALGSGSEEFFNNLRGAIGRNAGGVVTFTPTAAGAPVSTESVFSTLALGAPGSMTRAVENITFGGLNGETPFIVMRFASFDTVFGGMLRWEQQMAADLAPLFGSTGPITAIDSRVNNRDIRVLVGAGGSDQIVYGFIDKNTLLITKDRNSYSAIAPRVNP